MPMMLSGTDCKLSERLNTDIDPDFKKEARAMMETRAILLKARPSVLGPEIRMAFLRSTKFGTMENLGIKPETPAEIAWIRKCINAPRETPAASPATPKAGYKKTTPKIIPRL